MPGTLSAAHFYRGKLVGGDGNTTGDYQPTAVSRNWPTELALESVFQAVFIGKHNDIPFPENLAASVFVSHEKHIVAARVWQSREIDRGHHYPVYHILVLPFRKWLEELGGQLAPLFAALEAPYETDMLYPRVQQRVTEMKPLVIPLAVASTPTYRVTADNDALWACVSLAANRPLDEHVHVGIQDADPVIFAQQVLDLLPGTAKTRFGLTTALLQPAHGRFTALLDATGTVAPLPTLKSRYAEWLKDVAERDPANLYKEVQDIHELKMQSGSLNRRGVVRRLTANKFDDETFALFTPQELQNASDDMPELPQAQRQALLRHVASKLLKKKQYDEVARDFFDSPTSHHRHLTEDQIRALFLRDGALLEALLATRSGAGVFEGLRPHLKSLAPTHLPTTPETRTAIVHALARHDMWRELNQLLIDTWMADTAVGQELVHAVVDAIVKGDAHDQIAQFVAAAQPPAVRRAYIEQFLRHTSHDPQQVLVEAAFAIYERLPPDLWLMLMESRHLTRDQAWTLAHHLTAPSQPSNAEDQFRVALHLLMHQLDAQPLPQEPHALLPVVCITLQRMIDEPHDGDAPHLTPSNAASGIVALLEGGPFGRGPLEELRRALRKVANPPDR